MRYLIILSLLLGASCQPAVKVDDLRGYLEKKGQDPQGYVLSKFDNHDYVFLGEFHRIRHDLELYRKLIPRLYERGVYTLGFEFGCHEMQEQADSLVVAPEFDRKLAQSLLFRTNPGFNYKEYIDIYETVWQVNQDLQEGQRPFRIVGLTESFVPCGQVESPWQELDTDAYMAQAILKDIVAREKKALIIMGVNHAVTKYRFPSYDRKKDSLKGYFKRSGNYVYEVVGDRAITIYLNAVWPAPDFEHYVRPAQGAVDSVFELMGKPHLGFDVKNGPFAGLPGGNTFYGYGQQHFTLGDFCDGYVYQGPFTEAGNISAEPGFYNSTNLREYKCFLKRIGVNEAFVDSLSVKNANVLNDDIRNFYELLVD